MPPDSARPASSTAPEIVVERPPPGLGRGEYAWPAWAILALGSTIVVLGLVYVAFRINKRRRT
jgi:hypothetical protein